MIPGGQSRAEDHADYKYEDYKEEHGRIHIRTHSALFEKSFGTILTASGHFVYDGISGATPTGGPPPPGSTQVPTATIDDIRRAGNLEASVHLGITTTTPQVAYSLENDYESIGVALNHSIDLFEKNTTITLGVSHDFDTIMPKFWGGRKEHKDSTDFLLGVTQVLGPKTLLSANLTLGTSSGFLSDPYKGFRFDDYPDPTTLFPEKRPGHKTKQIFFLSLSQFIDPVNASGEVSYRFYHDSFGIVGHTASIAWFQKLGRNVVLSPMFRYYYQTAADFYAIRLPGDPSIPPDDPFFTVPVPEFYSSDYRLSELRSVTCGLSATIILKQTVYLDAAYKRYEMAGLDGATSASNYPEANIFTVGIRLWF
jgi:hypothetical protein